MAAVPDLGQLIGAGALVNAASVGGFVPLHVASQYGHVDCVRVLIEAGAIVDARAETGASPLYLACEYGRLECARVLIGAGARVMIQCRGGNTPLHASAAYAQVECARLLLYAGARKDMYNNAGKMPTQMSKMNPETPADRHKTTTSLIERFSFRAHYLAAWRQAAVAHRDTALVFNAAATGRPLELGKRLRLGKLDLAGGLVLKGTVQGGQQVSPLHAAMMGRHRECVKTLQGQGALLGDEEQAWIESQAEARQAAEDRVRELEARLAALGH